MLAKICSTKKTYANAEFAVGEVEMLAAFAIILQTKRLFANFRLLACLVLRGAVENGAHMLEVAFARLHRLKKLKCKNEVSKRAREKGRLYAALTRLRAAISSVSYWQSGKQPSGAYWRQQCWKIESAFSRVTQGA